MADSLERSYDDYPRIEAAFDQAADESLQPRGPDMLYDLVRELDLPAGSRAIDVGCGDGRHTVELVERFGFVVTGIDPVPPQLERARARLASLDADVRRRVTFEPGAAEELPFEAETADLVWCRDVLVLVADVEKAYAEFARILRPGGRVLVYQMFATDRLEPKEAEALWRPLGVVAASADPAHADAAIAAAGLRLDERVDLTTEWGEWAQEHDGKPARKLLHAARLLRDPERYITRFGRGNYEIKLADCLWHVYAMIGKLERRVYLLSND